MHYDSAMIAHRIGVDADVVVPRGSVAVERRAGVRHSAIVHPYRSVRCSDPLAHKSSHTATERWTRRRSGTRDALAREDARLPRARVARDSADFLTIVVVVVVDVEDGRRDVREAAIVAVARARLYWRSRVREPRRADGGGGGGSRFRRCARIRTLRATHVTARRDRSSARPH